MNEKTAHFSLKKKQPKTLFKFKLTTLISYLFVCVIESFKNDGFFTTGK